MAEHERWLGPAARFVHDHLRIRNVLAEHEQQLSLGQRVADRVAAAVGSWPFIIIQSFLLVAWIMANVYLAVYLHAHPGGLKAWDPYPFILLNLMLSFHAAYTGPVVMMSQNRQTEKDRLTAQNDYDINQKAEEEVKVIMDHLVHQDQLLIEIMRRLDSTGIPANQEEIRAGLDHLAESDRRIQERLGDAPEG